MQGHNRDERLCTNLAEDLQEARRDLERRQPNLSKGYQAFLEQYNAFLRSYLQFLGNYKPTPNSTLGASQWEK